MEQFAVDFFLLGSLFICDGSNAVTCSGYCSYVSWDKYRKFWGDVIVIFMSDEVGTMLAFEGTISHEFTVGFVFGYDRTIVVARSGQCYYI